MRILPCIKWNPQFHAELYSSVTRIYSCLVLFQIFLIMLYLVLLDANFGARYAHNNMSVRLIFPNLHHRHVSECYKKIAQIELSWKGLVLLIRQSFYKGICSYILKCKHAYFLHLHFKIFLMILFMQFHSFWFVYLKKMKQKSGLSDCLNLMQRNHYSIVEDRISRGSLTSYKHGQQTEKYYWSWNISQFNWMFQFKMAHIIFVTQIMH